ncbi:hypothetical protein JHK87_052872 [Glycine soja]|nr:hypothetical protein JHK87_052872 [Glycine soja]
MILPSPTTSYHQTTLPFSATSTSTLRKSFSQSDCHHEFRFINCLKQGLQRIMLRDLSDVDKIRRPIYIAGVMCNGKRSHAKMSQYDEILDQFVFMHPLGYREILVIHV